MSFVPSSTKMLPQYSLVQLSLSKTFNKYVVGEYKRTTLDKEQLRAEACFLTCQLVIHNGVHRFYYQDLMSPGDVSPAITRIKWYIGPPGHHFEWRRGGILIKSHREIPTKYTGGMSPFTNVTISFFITRKLVWNKGDVYVWTNVQLFLNPRVRTMRTDRNHLLGHFLVASEFSSCACHTRCNLCLNCCDHSEYAQQLYAKGKVGALFFN